MALDETGLSTNMVRRQAWASRSERLVTAALRGYWRTTTFMAGICGSGLVAPVVGRTGRDRPLGAVRRAAKPIIQLSARLSHYRVECSLEQATGMLPIAATLDLRACVFEVLT